MQINGIRSTFSPIKKIIPRAKVRFKPGAVILIYHRVASLPHYPYPIVSTPENFADQMDLLNKHYCPISLIDLADAIERRKIPNRAVVVTFDDGYIDNHTEALPILEAYKIPATIFVTTGNIRVKKEFWWDELEHILLGSANFPYSLEININGESHQWLTRTFFEKNQARRSIHLLIRPMSNQERNGFLTELASHTGQTRGVREVHRSMLVHELKQFARSNYVHIGAHTVTHPILSSLPYEEQYYEFARSRDELEAITGYPIEVCSYPYGSRDDFDDNSVKAAKNCGFRLACTTVHGLVQPGIEPFQLPRCWADNWNRNTFEKRLLSYFGV
jgi:peptidoglycan/xylan/chitin deacetylase (PgdA/CDA1 family)